MTEEEKRKYIECPECGGDGVCPVCGGTGEDTFDSSEPCPECKGYSDCPECDGTGVVEERDQLLP